MFDHILRTQLVTLFLTQGGLHLARAKCLAEMVSCLFTCRTVNLAILSSAFRSGAKPGSRYQRLRRFLAGVRFDESTLARMIAGVRGLLDAPSWTLMLDRTNWKFGRVHINLLVLSACRPGGKAAVPLFWSLLEDKKQGNSDFIDRADLIDRFVGTFGRERIGVLLGDREFVGPEWIGYLQTQGVPFVMRLRENGVYLGSSRKKK